MPQRIQSRNWAWDFFQRNNTKYLTDNTHWNAWCIGCLRFRSASLKEQDEHLVLYGQIQSVRSEEELFKQVMDIKHAICGKIRKLHLHLEECPYVDQDIRRRASYDQGSQRNQPQSTDPRRGDVDLPTASRRQEWFEKALCRTAASAGWSWNSLCDPEFISLMKTLCPDLEVPDRRVLSGRVLDREITRIVTDLKATVQDKPATGMCDGWKNVSRTSVVAFMITVDYQAHIISTHNISAERKTADNLLGLVLATIEYIENELGVPVVAWCTDASGECRAMRRKLHDRMPHLVTLDCYPHQINLVVGDVLKHSAKMREVAGSVNKIVKWFRNHSYPLGLLRKCQHEEYGVAQALIQAVITRWTAHYCSATRLLEITSAKAVLTWGCFKAL